jgi:hypothetical protein
MKLVRGMRLLRQRDDQIRPDTRRLTGRERDARYALPSGLWHQSGIGFEVSIEF